MVDGLVAVPDGMKDGGVLFNGTTDRTVSGGNSILSSLLTSHGGQYICEANCLIP